MIVYFDNEHGKKMLHGCAFVNILPYQFPKSTNFIIKVRIFRLFWKSDIIYAMPYRDARHYIALELYSIVMVENYLTARNEYTAMPANIVCCNNSPIMPHAGTIVSAQVDEDALSTSSKMFLVLLCCFASGRDVGIKDLPKPRRPLRQKGLSGIIQYHRVHMEEI